MVARLDSTSPATPALPQPPTYTEAPSLDQVRTGAAVKRGMQGDSVKVLQEKLGLPQDGKFGPGMERAVKEFQTRNGLPADGKIGRQTFAAISTPATTPAPGWNNTSRPTLPPVTTQPQVGTETRPNDFGNRLAAGGAQSIEMRMKNHADSIDRTGVGQYFGDHSSWKRMTPSERNAWVDSHVKGGWKDMAPEKKDEFLKNNLKSFSELSPKQQEQWMSYPLNETQYLSTEDKQKWFNDNMKPFDQLTPDQQQMWRNQPGLPGSRPANVSVPTPKENSCIGWAMENVGAAYAAAGKSDRWREIQGIVASKGSKGIDLAKELQKDGWQAIYWNPDSKNPNDGLAEHSFSAVQAHRNNSYYGLKLDGIVENYRPSGQGNPPTTADQSGIERLKQVPFFFGMAKGGMHTFVGRNANVNEFHWSEMPDSGHAIQESPLKDWGWNSGVIMVPPGTWPTGR